jgi:hypothetical protein
MAVHRSRRNAATFAAFGVLLMSGCTVAPPTGPTVAVMPGPGKSLAQFQQDDLACRQFASDRINGASPAQAANQAGIGSAAAGTLLGAAAGALLGAASGHAGAGAAIGAGAGLVTGSAVGAGNAQQSAQSLQQRYDLAYSQCMVTQGDRLPEAPPPPAYYYPYPPPPPPPPPGY